MGTDVHRLHGLRDRRICDDTSAKHVAHSLSLLPSVLSGQDGALFRHCMLMPIAKRGGCSFMTLYEKPLSEVV